MVSRRAVSDRLRRGEPLDYAAAAGTGFGPDVLTIGFARRLATYKRLHLVALQPDRALSLIGGDPPVQFVFAGKAHPNDNEAKEVVRLLFQLKGSPSVAGSGRLPRGLRHPPCRPPRRRLRCVGQRAAAADSKPVARVA